MNELEKAKKQLAKVSAKVKALKKEQTLSCKCGKENQLQSLVLKEIEFYVEPFSCSGGDYWTSGPAPEYNVECPHCKKVTRYHDYEQGWDTTRKELTFAAVGSTKFVKDNYSSFKEVEYVKRGR